MNLHIDADELDSLVERVVAATLERLDADRARFSGRLGYTEPEGAAALGVKPHVLRDARPRGEVHARRIGARYIYARDELLRFLADGAR